MEILVDLSCMKPSVDLSHYPGSANPGDGRGLSSVGRRNCLPSPIGRMCGPGSASAADTGLRQTRNARQAVSTDIGVLNEQPLHAALKQWYAQPNGRTEAAVDGFVVDVVCGRGGFIRGLLIEIQVGNFSSIKRKVRRLTEEHALRLVYPIPREKWLLKMPKREGGEVERRKSPKHGRVEEVFKELVSFPA